MIKFACYNYYNYHSHNYIAVLEFLKLDHHHLRRIFKTLGVKLERMMK